MFVHVIIFYNTDFRNYIDWYNPQPQTRTCVVPAIKSATKTAECEQNFGGFLLVERYGCSVLSKASGTIWREKHQGPHLKRYHTVRGNLKRAFVLWGYIYLGRRQPAKHPVYTGISCAARMLLHVAPCPGSQKVSAIRTPCFLYAGLWCPLQQQKHTV